MDNNRDKRQNSKLRESDLNIPISATEDLSRQRSQLTSTQRYSQEPVISEAEEQSLIRYNHITYLLYVLSYFTAGLLWIVPIIMNYVNRQQANNTWLATHFDWQIKTFWYSIIIGAVGLIIVFFGLGGLGLGMFAESSNMTIGSTALVIVGGIITLFAFIWHIYRIVKGWIALADKRPVQ